MLRTVTAGLLSVGIVAALAAPAGAAPWERRSARLGAGAVLFSDGFTGLPPGTWREGTVHGAWDAVYTGYGSIAPAAVGAADVLQLAPRAAAGAGETHAALVTSHRSFGDLDLTVRLRTQAQLRDRSPNPWEVGWVLWHYGDDVHFYSVLLKPTGWELGKEDPAYPGNQRFLATGSAPVFPVGPWHTVRVRQVGAAITVWVDGALLTSFTDRERPYLSGDVGLYDEDARVQFDAVTVRRP